MREHCWQPARTIPTRVKLCKHCCLRSDAVQRFSGPVGASIFVYMVSSYLDRRMRRSSLRRLFS